ncbi:MAG: BamA/TamA family outer membrane protein [Candidatus Coatesbacteria bacterium]|nr:MAG: BamA/TamA family outer membrane protein [Candidatus Coatesbacteria bacterium]
MSVRHYIPLLIAAALAGGAGALTVEGNEAFSTEEIELAAAAPGGVDVAAVERMYLSAGYLDVAVELVAAEAEAPHVVVAEGPRYEVATLEIVNASPLSRGEVEAFLPFGRGEAPSPPGLREGLEALLAALAGRGYLRAEAEYAIAAVAPGRAAVTVTVRGGERYTAGEIGFPGLPPAEAEDLRDELATRPGRPLRERELARDLLTVIDYYRGRGYAEATARPRHFELAERYREIDFDLQVNAGPQVVVTAIDIVGNRRTRDYVLRRELDLLPGEPYDLNRLRKSVRRLYNLRYFETEPTLELVDAHAGRLRLTVAERRTYRVTGALAYEPARAGEKAALIGEAEAKLANLAGTGREAQGRYLRRAVETAEAEARYYEPWIGGVDLFAEPRGEFRERPAYRKAEGELAVGTHPLTDLTVAGGAGFGRVWGENASRKYKVFTWARYDSRDYFDNPRRGWEAGARLELGVKNYEADDFQERVPRFTLEAWRFFPLGRTQVLAARLRGQGFSSARPSLDEFYPLGGHADLRGYKQEQFLTDRNVLATAEYRFLVGRDNRLFLFVDGAYRHLRAEHLFAEGFEAGYGAGFRAKTPVGIYGVDYGLAVGEGPLEGKIHVTITQEF